MNLRTPTLPPEGFGVAPTRAGGRDPGPLDRGTIFDAGALGPIVGLGMALVTLPIPSGPSVLPGRGTGGGVGDRGASRSESRTLSPRDRAVSVLWCGTATRADRLHPPVPRSVKNAAAACSH